MNLQSTVLVTAASVSGNVCCAPQVAHASGGLFADFRGQVEDCSGLVFGFTNMPINYRLYKLYLGYMTPFAVNLSTNIYQAKENIWQAPPAKKPDSEV